MGRKLLEWFHASTSSVTSSRDKYIVTLVTRSPIETELLGRRLGSALKKGAFLALYGDLGGGKTCFTRGIVAAAAPESLHLVASPTFAIMNEYPGIVPVYHFDFYRLSSGHEIAELGFDDFFDGDGICIAEWAERLGEMLPREHIKVHFEHAGNDERRITVTASSHDLLTLLEQLETGAHR
jgi:tRNA threonylcarbamoyladenosine biosynthesis protein TsaE